MKVSNSLFFFFTHTILYDAETEKSRDLTPEKKKLKKGEKETRVR